MAEMRDTRGPNGHDDPEADHVDDDGGQHDLYGAIGKAHRNSGKERPTRLRPVPENGNDAIHGIASPFRHPGLVPGSNAPTACHRVLKFGCRNKSGMTEGKYALSGRSGRRLR